MHEFLKGLECGAMPALTIHWKANPYFAINTSTMELEHLGDYVYPAEAWMAAREKTAEGVPLMMPNPDVFWKNEAQQGRTLLSITHQQVYYICWDEKTQRPRLIAPNAPTSARQH